MKMEFKGIEDYIASLEKLGDNYDETVQKMLKAGMKLLYEKVKSASPKFAKYMKIKKPTKNEFGWFTAVIFKGKTSSDASATLAASVYEHGREYRKQPARPFVGSAVAAAESQVVEIMQKVYDEEAQKIGGK